MLCKIVVSSMKTNDSLGSSQMIGNFNFRHISLAQGNMGYIGLKLLFLKRSLYFLFKYIYTMRIIRSTGSNILDV
jgi:hypothetical protein